MAPTQPSALPAATTRAELQIAITNTVGKLQSDAALQKLYILSGSTVKIIETRISSEEALKATAQVLSSNEIKLQIVDEGMQLTQNKFFPDEADDEEERRRKRALITK